MRRSYRKKPPSKVVAAVSVKTTLLPNDIKAENEGSQIVTQVDEITSLTPTNRVESVNSNIEKTSKCTNSDTAIAIVKKKRKSSTLKNEGNEKVQTSEVTVKRASKVVKTEVDIEEVPKNFFPILELVKEMRARTPAPVDSMGCDKLGVNETDAKERRFVLLMGLMLSAQTKDEVTAAAVSRLQQNLDGGLTVRSVIHTPVDVLDELICPVGFHNKKARYIKAAAEILDAKYDGDIPETIVEMMALPGVGPKMAHLLLQAAWNRTEGIGVDVHVHRLANLWGWVPETKTPTPEKTRIALERWMPRELWQMINPLLVGFGQTICLPRHPKCDICTIAPKGLCPAARLPAKPRRQKSKNL